MPKKLETGSVVARRRHPWLRRTLKAVTGVGLAAVIFVGGWALGSGRLHFNRLSSQQSAHTPRQLDLSSVQEVYSALRQNYDGQLDEAVLLDGIKEGLARATGDPYTEYFNQEAAKEFDEDLNGTFSGIGAELGRQDSSVVVIAPISGFPAEKAGLKAKDVIVEIDGKTAYDIGVNEAVKRIRGPKGTKVTLKVVRDSKQELTLEITRDNITIPSVESKVENGIGYLKISRFAEDTVALSQQAATSFKQAGVSGVIVDVRGDPGGLLAAAVDVSSLWLPKGKTVLEERRGGNTIQTYRSSGRATLQGIPTVVLIDGGSASASEILAGALKDNGAASLLGEKSYGKGSVQTLDKLSGGSMLKVTIARWYTPAGRNIDKEGIEPDQTVTRTSEDFTAGRDPQKDAATTKLRQ